jgi:hypothetical protein
MKILAGLLAFGTLLACTAAKPDPAEVQSVVQATLDHPALEKYLHPEKPGRKPLVLSDWLIGGHHQLTKFGQPVEFRNDPALGDHVAFIRFTDVSVRGQSAKTVLDYPVEGVRGSFEFKKDAQGKWQTTDAKVFER